MSEIRTTADLFRALGAEEYDSYEELLEASCARAAARYLKQCAISECQDTEGREDDDPDALH